MRPWAIALGVVVSLSSTTRADDSTDAKAVIERAIKAAGGADKLAKYPAIKRKGKGTLQLDNDSIPFTFESTLQGTDKVRLEFQIETATLMGANLLLYDGKKGWAIDSDKKITDLPEEGSFPFFKDDYRALRLAELLMPLLSKDYKLAPLGEIKVDKRAAVGVKASENGHPDYDLYFDKETGLPIKAAFRLKETADGQEHLHEFYFSAYKEVGGLQRASKLRTQRDEKKHLDIEWTEITPLEKVEKGTFDKP
jgi:hypothetical protein